MPDPADPTFVLALWVAAGLWLGWLFVPVLVSAAGGTRYANGGTEDPALARPDGTDPDYAALHDELAALGYEPLGAGFMRVRFQGQLWGYRTRVWAFRSRAAGDYAFVQLSPPLPGVHQLYFATCWADGGLLLTAASTAEVRLTRDGYTHQELPTFRPAGLAHAHRLAAAEERAAGRRPDPDGSLDTLLRVTEAHAGPLMREQARASARRDLWGLIGLLAAPAALALLLGVDHWVPPAALLAALAVATALIAVGKASTAADLRRRVHAEREEPSAD